MRISYKQLSGDIYNGARYADRWAVGTVKDLKTLSRAMLGASWSPCIWRGGQRLTKNFAGCEFLALDFDTPDFKLDQAINNIFCDMQHVIGTTRSHRKEKGGITADRFRVVIPFDTPISSVDEYAMNMRHVLRQYPSADRSCRDAARFFFPCQEIVSVCADDDAFKYEKRALTPRLKKRIEIEKSLRQLDRKDRGKVTSSVRQFLDHGVLLIGKERNDSCFIAACELFELGKTQAEVESLLRSAPFPKDGFLDSEYTSVTNSAYRRVNASAP